MQNSILDMRDRKEKDDLDFKKQRKYDALIEASYVVSVFRKFVFRKIPKKRLF